MKRLGNLRHCLSLGTLLLGLSVLAITPAKGQCPSAAGECALTTGGCPSCKTTGFKNEDFYTGGKFDAVKAKEAYFAMFQRLGYPIPPRLKTADMWVSDFGLGDFVHVGMAGIFWYNDKDTNVFGHEIFLLPGQMIVEHGHEQAGGVAPKREAWQVRNGWIATFGEGDDTSASAPVKLPESQAKFITVKHWNKVCPGEVDSLKRAAAKHFMIAGPEGAVVTEYGTFHDNAGLRFTDPGVKF